MLPYKVSKNMAKKFLKYLSKEESIELLKELCDTRHLNGKIIKSFEEVKVAIENFKIKETINDQNNK